MAFALWLLGILVSEGILAQPEDALSPLFAMCQEECACEGPSADGRVYMDCTITKHGRQNESLSHNTSFTACQRASSMSVRTGDGSAEWKIRCSDNDSDISSFAIKLHSSDDNAGSMDPLRGLLIGMLSAYCDKSLALRICGSSELTLPGCSQWFSVDLSHNEIHSLANVTLPSAKVMDLSHNWLTSFLTDEEGPFQHTAVLNLSHNLIEKLNRGMLHGARELHAVDLRHNTIEQIDPGVFDCHVRELRTLDLSHNHLTSLEANTLQDLTHLQLLNLSHNSLNSISDRFAANNGSADCKGSKDQSSAADNITTAAAPPKLDLSLEEEDEEQVIDWEGFETLDLRYNNLSWVGDSILHGPLRKVRVLLLGHNNIVHLPHYAIERIIKLRVLDLSYNKLYWLDVGTFNNEHLERIDLSHNQLTKIISMAFLYLPEVIHIDLSHNQLNYIYKFAFYRTCKKDQRFDVTFASNELETDTIWRLVSTFHHLEKTNCQLYVNLTGNRISHFVENIDRVYSQYLSTKNLDYFSAWNHIHFHLSANPINCDCALYNEVKLLSHIQYAFAENVSNAENLDFWKGLNCSNMIGTVPAVLDKMKCAPSTVHCPNKCFCKPLQHDLLLVNCSSRKLTEVPMLPQVGQISLNMSYNHIYELLDVQHLWNVTILDLSHNSLEVFDSGVFQHMTRLERLLLHNNNLEHVPPSIQNLENLTQVTLYGNPLSCSCADDWLIHWFRNNSHLLDHSAAQLLCPSGQKLVDVDPCSLQDASSEMTHTVILYASMISLGVTAIVLASIVTYLLCRKSNWYTSLVGESKCSHSYFQYDMFICYSPEDSSHLFEMLIAGLLDISPHIRMAPEVVNIPEEEAESRLRQSLESSRCTVVIISQTFLTRYWDLYKHTMLDLVHSNHGVNFVFIVLQHVVCPADLASLIQESRAIHGISDGRDCAGELLNYLWEVESSSTLQSSWDNHTDKVTLVPQEDPFFSSTNVQERY